MKLKPLAIWAVTGVVLAAFWRALHAGFASLLDRLQLFVGETGPVDHLFILAIVVLLCVAAAGGRRYRG